MLDDDLYIDLDRLLPLDEASKSSSRGATIERSGPHDPADHVATVRMDQVEAEAVNWLWPGYLPQGKVVVVDGDPDVGKSTLLMDIAARVSTGGAMPDGHQLVGPSDVLIMPAEDGLADTLKPRLVAAGADTARVHAIDGMIGLPGDVDRLEAFIQSVNAGILIVDPFTAYLQKVNISHEMDLRRVMGALIQIAERTHATIILVRHLNKGTARRAMYRGMGGIGIAAAARVVLLVAHDLEDQSRERRVLAVTKGNLAAHPPSLAYRLEDSGVLGCAKVRWDGPTALTADDLLAMKPTRSGQSGTSDCDEALGAILMDGEVAANVVYRQMDDAGFSRDQTKRAKKRLGVKTRKVGTPGGADQGWVWTLP
jgi:KaiC/GvpD/RAD55 family RecA-like ATPase